jgi:cytoskeletal protein RodZ
MADSASTVSAKAGGIQWWGWIVISAVVVVVVAAVVILVILFTGSKSSSGSFSSTSGSSGSISRSGSTSASSRSSFASSSASGPHLPVAGTKYNIIAENGTSTQNHVSSSNNYLNVDLDSSGSSQQQWSFTLVTPISATSGIYTIVNQAGSAIDSTNSATLLAAPTGSSNQQWTVTIQNVTSLWGNSTVVTINQGYQYLTYSIPGNTFSQVTLATSTGSITQLFSYQ